MCEDEFVVETVVSSSEFIVDDVNARNFNDKTFGSSAVLKSPIELHNAYFAAGVLAAAIFIVAVVVTICHCNVNQTYRKFSTRSSSFIPILGFSRRPKLQGALNKHWLSGKGLNAPTAATSQRDATSAAATAAAGSHPQSVQSTRHLPSKPNGSSSQTQTTLGGQLQERPFQRHLAMNFENDMYYTVDFAENSQNSPLIQ
ncbi:GH22223 [Drosophila grimshawi]|nr:GH22223 [Drosophila grimshawi]